METYCGQGYVYTSRRLRMIYIYIYWVGIGEVAIHILSLKHGRVGEESYSLY